jgi:alanine racemase
MQSGVDLFAVANVKEASEIREMGSGWPILILGPLLEEEDEALIEFDLIPTLSSQSELDRFRILSQKHQKPISAHLKIDSGMGRTGIWWKDAPALIEDIKKSKEIKLCGALTHFAQPSDLSFTEEQRNRFLAILEKTAIHKQPDFLVHADNSSSLRSFDRKAIFNAVRIGLLQFGVSPPQGSILADLRVEPVLSFHAKLAMIKELPAGTSLSYGRQFTLKRDSRIGIISAGYGDAIPLACGNRASGLIDGRAYPLVGRVTMDRFNRCTARNSSRANRYPNRKTRGSGNFTFPTSHSLRNHSMGTALFDHQASASGLYNQEGVKAFLGVKVLLDRLDDVR